MNPKRIQLFLILGTCAITLHFSLLFAKESIFYFSLSHTAPATITRWEIAPVKKKFVIKADYTFGAEGNPLSGSHTFKTPLYLNERAAFLDLKKMAKDPWIAFYKAKDPESSCLEKSFPTGLLIRTLICYGVVAYFFILRRNYNRLLNSI